MVVQPLAKICHHIEIQKDTLTAHKYIQAWQRQWEFITIRGVGYGLSHGLRTPREDIVFTAWPKIHSHSQIFRCGQSIFCLPHRPNFSDIFDLCLHRVPVVRGLSEKKFKLPSLPLWTILLAVFFSFPAVLGAYSHSFLPSAAILKSSAYRISSYRQNCALGVRFPAAPLQRLV